jgi:hypothetical protein
MKVKFRKGKRDIRKHKKKIRRKEDYSFLGSIFKIKRKRKKAKNFSKDILGVDFNS